MNIQTISPRELYERVIHGDRVDLINARTPAEFREMCLKIARWVPLATLDPKKVMAERNGTAGEPLYVICQPGNRSRQACEKFVAAGYTNVVNVEGGTNKPGFQSFGARRPFHWSGRSELQPDRWCCSE